MTLPNLNDHDVLRAERNQIVKADDRAPYPHVQCCSGCRRLRVCHGCGFPIGRFPVVHFTRSSCTSGACPRCCTALHNHPQG